MKRRETVIALGLSTFILGYLVGMKSFSFQDRKSTTIYKFSVVSSDEKRPEDPTMWTCSMHPQIRLSKPGKCPICFMDLVPVGGEEGLMTGGYQSRLAMSDTARDLAAIKTAPVVKKDVIKTIKIVGKFEYDETQVYRITAWVAGRIDRLYVNYTGARIKKGDPLISLYSPELISAQQEYIQALNNASNLKEISDGLSKEMAISTLKASEEKLRLLGLTKRQIERIRKRRRVVDHLTVYSPVSGIVIKKKGFEGTYVSKGTLVYTVADLSEIWAFFDAYESDLVWLRYGQEVEFTVEAYPGEVFKGRIAFIDPLLDDRTRTAKVRVNVVNPDGRLRPGMFMRGEIKVHLLKDGRVFSPEFAGKWVCPVHPEVVEDGPGICKVCKRRLVSSEDLGYAAKEDPSDMPLVIPETAPLLTGKRAVVYVEVADASQPVYEGRVLELGPKADGYYIVRSGLKEGERVVVEGNFKIDSELQIRAGSSMMSVYGEEEKSKASGSKYINSLSPILSSYMLIQRYLFNDDFRGAKKEMGNLAKHAKSMGEGPSPDEEGGTWSKLRLGLISASEAGAQASSMGKVRESFASLSKIMISMVKKFGQPGKGKLYEMYCPMAFGGEGASWMQGTDEVSNPYFGSKMPKCGSQKAVYLPHDNLR